MASGVEAGDAMDNAGERGALVLLDEAPIADVLEPPVGDGGGDLLHGVQAEIAAVGKDRGGDRHGHARRPARPGARLGSSSLNSGVRPRSNALP